MTLYGQTKINKKHDELMEEYMEFLLSINGYIDDMYNIFKCFYSISEVISSRQLFSYQWLRNISRDKDLFENFYNDFKNYRDYLTAI